MGKQTRKLSELVKGLKILGYSFSESRMALIAGVSPNLFEFKWEKGELLVTQSLQNQREDQFKFDLDQKTSDESANLYEILGEDVIYTVFPEKPTKVSNK